MLLPRDTHAQAVEPIVQRVRHREAQRVLVVQLVRDPRCGRPELVDVLHDFRVAARVVRDSAQRIWVHARVQRARVLPIDGHRVEERVGSWQLRAQIAQLDVARRVGAIRDDDAGRPLTMPRLEQRQRHVHRVVNRRAAPAVHGVERRAQHLGLRRPARRHRRRVVEQDQRVLVLFGEQLEEEAIEGMTGVLEALADHAVADVQQDGQADGDARRGKLRHGLLDAVLVDFELVGRQVRHELAVGIRHRGRHGDQLHPRLEVLLSARGPIRPLSRGWFSPARRAHRARHRAARAARMIDRVDSPCAMVSAHREPGRTRASTPLWQPPWDGLGPASWAGRCAATCWPAVTACRFTRARDRKPKT